MNLYFSIEGVVCDVERRLNFTSQSILLFGTCKALCPFFLILVLCFGVQNPHPPPTPIQKSLTLLLLTHQYAAK
jgi:hypothetical protein